VDEPISPELVLVCPELRARALAELRARVEQTIPHVAVQVDRRGLGGDALLVAGSLWPVGFALALTTVLTLALTLVADALR
jgi:hypothetical protein